MFRTNDGKTGFYKPKKEKKKRFADELESAPKHRESGHCGCCCKKLLKRIGVFCGLLTATAYVLTNRDKSK